MTGEKDTIVHIDNVTKRFGNVVAVDQLDMKIMAGEFVTFLGPSGCGKSTTLRMLGGFENPTEGRIVLDGVDVTSQPPNRRDVNMVFQDYALFPHMTVGQNVSFGLELKGKSRPEIERRMTELLDFLQLSGFRDRTPDQLSGGQRQRVALARALAPDPKLLLLDEPLGALDAKLRGQVQIELKDIQKRTGKTFFFVTHDQEEALTMSDRIVVMNAGRVEQDGTPEDLYFRPESRFVAEFIGETNLINGTVRGVEENAVVLDWNGLSIRGSGHGHRPAAGDNVTASLRLENVTCHNKKPANQNAVEGKVISKLFKGSRTSLDIRVGEREDSIIRAYMDAGNAAEIANDQLWISWEPERLTVLRD
ncbi:ABC transporter ATP-binding protein (plasmid) [Nitratireductor sp. L1-7-SE]|uniref:Spermidine/putrescine import ATP-binding protein PotA n=1 Tax=Nitratireductor rhodophyticola TaxID=2854036 RepID=A0ABS7RCF6_9HYPH|nr:ABC transporter ATP-binding protein [Nitratireductor rhodophyticola]MBY8918596.1 ABC transporter ATP-binding protein [Nitratireductor rhodophyticola]MBY8922939.1 ABC transporter ATP-binding protein [Nitratireductor rhodophyticola]